MATSIKSDVRFPRETITRLLNQLVLPIIGHSQHFIGGSYIRQSATCGDLDIAARLDADTLQRFMALGSPIVSGPVIKRLAVPFEDLTIQVDLWNGQSAEGWGPLCAFVAGSGRLNTRQRFQASRQGYTLGFDLKKGGKIIDCPTEIDLYSTLGWRWIDYASRSI